MLDADDFLSLPCVFHVSDGLPLGVGTVFYVIIQVDHQVHGEALKVQEQGQGHFRQHPRAPRRPVELHVCSEDTRVGKNNCKE